MSDFDKDGLTDELERRIGTDPRDKDSDNDGLMDGAERRLGTKPTNYDSDGDGFADGSELAQRRDPLHGDAPHPYGFRDPQIQSTSDDPDADTLDEMQESMLGTKADDPDTDDDGVGDWVEGLRRTDPTRPLSNGPGDKTTDLDDAVEELRQMRTAATSGTKLSAAGAVGPGDPTAGTPLPSAGDVDPRDITLTGWHGRAAFIEAARAQLGDRYKLGAEADMDDPNPNAFDSSELVQWSARQAGGWMPDGSLEQYRYLHETWNTMSVEEALKTPGALLFGFSSDPLATTGRPSRSYVGISTGDGKVIDVSERTGKVSVLDPGNFYTHAGAIPEFMDDLDSDGDGVTDEIERIQGGDPFDPTTTRTGPAPVTSQSADDADDRPTTGTDASGPQTAGAPTDDEIGDESMAAATSASTATDELSAHDSATPPARAHAETRGLDAPVDGGASDTNPYDDSATTTSYDDTTTSYDDSATTTSYDDTTTSYDATTTSYDATTTSYDDSTTTTSYDDTTTSYDATTTSYDDSASYSG